MLDVKEIRNNTDRLREIIRLRKVDVSKANLDRWLELDDKRRLLRAELDKSNSEKNKLAGIGKNDPSAARIRG